METIIGRAAEQDLLAKVLKSAEPELIAVYGRRRVGKTFLILNGPTLSLVASVICDTVRVVISTPFVF